MFGNSSVSAPKVLNKCYNVSTCKKLIWFYFCIFRHRNSSPSPDHYRNGEPQPYNLHNYLPSHASMHSPPTRPPPPCYPHSRLELPSPHEGPLNLTMNNNNNANNGSHSPTQSRPSVITCTTLPDRRFDTNSNGSLSPSRKESSTGNS
jgi:hypothetical protein